MSPRWIVLALAAALITTWVADPGATSADEPPAGPVRVAAVVEEDARALGVGRRLPALELALLAPRKVKASLDSLLAGKQALVIALRDELCPLCKRTGPALRAIEQAFAERGVAFLVLDASEGADGVALGRDAERFGFVAARAHDRAAATALGARSTTEVFVIDRARTLRYRGAIDDQHGIGFTRKAPRVRFLAAALDAVLGKQQVEVEATRPPGCALELGAPPKPAKAGEPTYHGRISRIVARHCQRCHRDGGAGPFPLETYAQLKARKDMIKFVVGERLMPPWGAEQGGPWRRDHRLTEEDRDALLGYLAGAMPEGDPAQAPAPLVYPKTWRMGEPDLVIDAPRSFRIPASGRISYRYVFIQVPTTSEKWIKAVEVIPTQPQVVHHVLGFLERPRQPGESRRDWRRRREGGLRTYFFGLTPGQRVTRFPLGTGKRLPAGAWIKLQIHYTPNGTAVEDRVKIGFRFHDSKPAREVVTRAAANTSFRIPPGAANHRVVAWHKFRRAGELIAYAPHSHLRGKAWRYVLRRKDGSRKLLLEIPRFDFNWQLRYVLAEPMQVEAGDVLEATAWYDNSEDNAANPDATQVVRFGEQTEEEMMIGYFEWVAR